MLVFIGILLYLHVLTPHDTLNITIHEYTHVYIHDYIPYYIHSMVYSFVLCIAVPATDVRMTSTGLHVAQW